MPSITERVASLETDLHGHKESCVIDKGDMRDQLKAINNKLWGIGAAVVVNLLVLVGYLLANGVPWKMAIMAWIERVWA